MVKNKGIEEQEYFEQFLITPVGKNWYKQNCIVSIEKTESPDFFLKNIKGERIALEMTSFIAKNKNLKFTQSLMTIGNQVIAYIKKVYNLDVSILIDKFDQRKWCGNWNDYIERVYNPGFSVVPPLKELKNKIQAFVDGNIELLKKNFFIKNSIQIQNDYFNITAGAFTSLNGKYDCHVNNAGQCTEDPFDELQDCINNKNLKLDIYSTKCDQCVLLIVVPSSAKGNYCHFTQKLKKHKFKSDFSSIFLYNENDRSSCILRKNKQFIRKIIWNWNKSLDARKISEKRLRTWVLLFLSKVIK